MKVFESKLIRFGLAPTVIILPAIALHAFLADLAKPFDNISWFIFGAIFLCVGLPLVPIIAYLWNGWEAKRNDISASVSTRAKECYLKMFSLSDYQINRQAAPFITNDANSPEARCDRIFADFYKRWYGRRYYILPVAVFTATLTYLSIHIAYSAANMFPYWETQHRAFAYSLNPASLSAIAGAYLWVTSDFISRARCLDFAPSEINWGTLRLIIALPMGHAFASHTWDGLASVVAFGLGAFPLSMLQDMLRQRVNTWMTNTVPKPDRNNSLTKLQGVNKTLAVRMENEGITTIPQIACCDPIRLVMRSNLTFNFVIDCINQSLCWVYFEDQLRNLRPLGLRGAVEIANLKHSLESTDQAIRTEAEATLADLARAIQPPHTEATLRHTFRQIANNPYTHFLQAVLVNPFEPPPARRAQTAGIPSRPDAGAGFANGHGAFPH